MAHRCATAHTSITLHTRALRESFGPDSEPADLTGHYQTLSQSGSRSRAARSAAIPRAVWLFTAPRLMPIAVAISASDRSA